MTKNLETADMIGKLILAIAVLVFYFKRLIIGPFATALMIISIIVILVFIMRLVYARIFMD